MLSNEITALAVRCEDTANQIDLSNLARKLRILAVGVGALEAITIGASARLIPASVRHRTLTPTTVADAAERLAREVQS